MFHGPISASYSGTGHYPGGDALTAGSSDTTVVVSKPHITLTVSPSAPSGPAPFPVTYTYMATNDSPVDPDVGQPRPALLAPNSDISGDAGRTYTITATNSGNQPTSGVVTLHDALPADLTLAGISGDGWSCEAATATCTRADVRCCDRPFLNTP